MQDRRNGDRRMVAIRPVRADDLDALYRIALATGDGGADASALYRDPKLLGHIYVAPYVVLCPQTVFVAEDADSVGGYIVGAADTPAFETRLEAEWWPGLRTTYPAPCDVSRAEWTRDQRMTHMIHHPRRTPNEITDVYPSHLHINLLPRLRGRGAGRALMDRWLRAVYAAGSTGAHLAVGSANARAIRFYTENGFRALAWPPYPAVGAIWLGIALESGLRD
jgi:ribosomal protein S18 acetylase RimI-like enzyme